MNEMPQAPSFATLSMTEQPIPFLSGTARRWMIYTIRRAAAEGPGVAWVHGSNLGVASSSDGGASWVYRGGAVRPGYRMGPQYVLGAGDHMA